MLSRRSLLSRILPRAAIGVAMAPATLALAAAAPMAEGEGPALTGLAVMTDAGLPVMLPDATALPAFEDGQPLEAGALNALSRSIAELRPAARVPVVINGIVHYVSLHR